MENKPFAYTVMSTFVIINTASYILLKFQDLQIVVTKDGTETYFRHPIFQANCIYIFEFAIMNCLVWPLLHLNKERPSKWFDFNTKYLEFMPAAMFDWLDRIFLTIGMS